MFHALLLCLDASGQVHAPVDLSLGKDVQYPLDRRLVGPKDVLATAVAIRG
jgi:hypothetical protein